MRVKYLIGSCTYFLGFSLVVSLCLFTLKDPLAHWLLTLCNCMYLFN